VTSDLFGCTAQLFFSPGNGVKILPRRGRYVESCTGRQNFNVLSRKKQPQAKKVLKTFVDAYQYQVLVLVE
jgi:hypothetical protein